MEIYRQKNSAEGLVFFDDCSPMFWYVPGSASGVTDYAYSSPYSQYTTSPYGGYNYATGPGGLLSK